MTNEGMRGGYDVRELQTEIRDQRRGLHWKIISRNSNGNSYSYSNINWVSEIDSK